jgi:hypothetical protein
MNLHGDKNWNDRLPGRAGILLGTSAVTARLMDLDGFVSWRVPSGCLGQDAQDGGRDARPPRELKSRNYITGLLSKTLFLLLALTLTAATGFAAVLAPASTPAAPMKAAATAAAATDIRDIRGPISIPYGWLWAAYVAGGLVLAAVLYGAWRWYRAQAKERAKEPDEIALERLEKARALMSLERAREYSFAVSEITRTYIEARFHERAARRTTEEFLHDLLAQADTPLSRHRALLEDFLQYCDLAKFAKWQLSLADMESMHESARAFILETRPQPAATKPVAQSLNGASAPAAEPQLTHSRS